MNKQILDQKQLKTIFAKLLGSKNAWIPFTNYIWKLPIDDAEEFIHQNDLNILFEMDPRDWIQRSFEWQEASEDFNFWLELNDRWLDIIEMNNDKNEIY